MFRMLSHGGKGLSLFQDTVSYTIDFLRRKTITADGVLKQ